MGRAGTLGGCTAHNAMIFVYPHNADWDYIAGLTGDPTWSAASMRRYFESLERCRHRPLYRLLARLGINPTRHGWKGWLPVETAIPLEGLTDRKLRRVFIEAGIAAVRAAPNFWQRMRWFLRFNPMSHILVSYQQILFDGDFHHWEGLAFAALCGLMTFAVGAFLFERLRDTLAEEV